MVIKGISDKIVERLDNIGWNKAVLAQKLDFSEKSLQRLLDSEDVKKLDTFVLICQKLGLSPLTLLASNVLRHPFLDYFNIFSTNESEGHLVDLVFDYGESSAKKHIVFTRGEEGEYYSEHKEEDFENLKVVYPERFKGFDNASRGLKAVELSEDTPELGLLERDFALCLNKPRVSNVEYMRYGIGHAVIEVKNNKGGFDYGIIRPIEGSTISFQEAMEVEDNVLVFADAELYYDWLKNRLPQSKYDVDLFKAKVFESSNFMEESSFNLYPVIGFVKNLTYRIVQSYLNKNKG